MSVGQTARSNLFVNTRHINVHVLSVNKSITARTLGGKALLKDFNITLAGNRLHWIEQSGIASSEREQMTMKQRESANQKESTKSAKPEPRSHHLRRHSQK